MSSRHYYDLIWGFLPHLDMFADEMATEPFDPSTVDSRRSVPVPPEGEPLVCPLPVFASREEER